MSSRRIRSLTVPFAFLLTTALLCMAALGLCYLRASFPSPSTLTPSDAEPSPPPAFRTVVIDAGHGGEDGGAVSTDGLQEKDVNLAVAMALRDLLEAAGIPTVMTRTQDILLYDRSTNYQGRKKVLDLAARRQIADSTENCLFISIHMNAFPQTQYSGMQVWYGTEHNASLTIAASIQSAALMIQPSNSRKIKAAGSNIYLLDRITAPAVLVECGFLSNPQEAAMLSEEEYQRQVAFVIFSAICGFAEEA